MTPEKSQKNPCWSGWLKFSLSGTDPDWHKGEKNGFSPPAGHRGFLAWLHPPTPAEPELCRRFGQENSQGRSQTSGFERSGRAGSAVTARPRRGAATTRCHPPPSPRDPRSRGAGAAPRGVPGHVGGDQAASQARYCPVSMATPGCSIPQRPALDPGVLGTAQPWQSLSQSRTP